MIEGTQRPEALRLCGTYVRCEALVGVRAEVEARVPADWVDERRSCLAALPAVFDADMVL